MWTPTTGPTTVSTEHTLSLPWGPRGTWHRTPGWASPQDAAASPDLDFWSLAARAALPGPTVEKYLPCARAGAWPCGQHVCGRHHERTAAASGTGAQSGRPSMQGRQSGRVKVCGSSQYRADRVAAGSPGGTGSCSLSQCCPRHVLRRTGPSSGPPPAQEKLVGSERCVWVQNVLTEQEDEIKFWIFCFQLNDFVSQFSHLQEAWGKQPKGLAKTKRRTPPTWGPRKGRTSASAAASLTRS